MAQPKRWPFGARPAAIRLRKGVSRSLGRWHRSLPGDQCSHVSSTHAETVRTSAPWVPGVRAKKRAASEHRDGFDGPLEVVDKHPGVRPRDNQAASGGAGLQRAEHGGDNAPQGRERSIHLVGTSARRCQHRHCVGWDATWLTASGALVRGPCHRQCNEGRFCIENAVSGDSSSHIIAMSAFAWMEVVPGEALQFGGDGSRVDGGASPGMWGRLSAEGLGA